MTKRRYWFPTQLPIRRRNLVVFRKLKKTKPEHGPWLVGTLGMLDKLRAIDEYYTWRYVKLTIEPRQYNNHLPYAESYTSAKSMGILLEDLQKEIMWGKGQLEGCFGIVSDKGLIGKLVPDPFAFAPHRTEAIINRYQSNTDFQEAVTASQKLLFELISVNEHPDGLCKFLDGYSNSAYTSIEYKRGQCDDKSSILSGILGTIFETRVVGFDKATINEWKDLFVHEGLKFEDYAYDMCFDRHFWIQVKGPEGWTSVDTIHPSGRDLKDYEVFFRLANRIGTVCQEYTLKTRD